MRSHARRDGLPDEPRRAHVGIRARAAARRSQVERALLGLHLGRARVPQAPRRLRRGSRRRVLAHGRHVVGRVVRLGRERAPHRRRRPLRVADGDERRRGRMGQQRSQLVRLLARSVERKQVPVRHARPRAVRYLGVQLRRCDSAAASATTGGGTRVADTSFATPPNPPPVFSRSRLQGFRHARFITT